MKALVVCTEIGSAAALKEILISENVKDFYFEGSNLAKFFFAKTKAFNIIDFDHTLNIKNINRIYLGSTLGPCAESKIYNNQHFSNLKKISVIDSYWNISQRFADMCSGERWKFNPDVIYVPNNLICKKLIDEGYKGSINLFNSPSFSVDCKKDKLNKKDLVRNAYGIKSNSLVFIFISEYAQETPDSWNVEVDQFNYTEIEHSLNLFNKRVDYLNRKGFEIVPFIKWHPTLLDKVNLEKFLHQDAIQINSMEKADLFNLGDIFFGLNSMLFLEARNRGLKVFSLMSNDMKSKNNLSNYYEDIIWKDSYDFKNE